MATSTTEDAPCEKCCTDNGIRHYNTNTNEYFFECGACGWEWGRQIRRYGQTTLARLKALLAGEVDISRAEINALLDGLIAQCREHGHVGHDSWLTRLQTVRATVPEDRGPNDVNTLMKLIVAYPRGMWALEDGKPVFDYYEGYGSDPDAL